MFCERGWLVRSEWAPKKDTSVEDRRWLGNPWGTFHGAEGSRGTVQGVSSRYLGWDSPGIFKGWFSMVKQFWRLYPKSTKRLSPHFPCQIAICSFFLFQFDFLLRCIHCFGWNPPTCCFSPVNQEVVRWGEVFLGLDPSWTWVGPDSIAEKPQ